MKKYSPAPNNNILTGKTTLVDYGFKCLPFKSSSPQHQCSDPQLMNLLYYNRLNQPHHQQLKPNPLRRQNKRGKFIALMSARQKKLDNYSTLNRRMQSSVSGKPMLFQTYEDQQADEEEEEEEADEDEQGDDTNANPKSLSNSNIKSMTFKKKNSVRFFKSRQKQQVVMELLPDPQFLRKARQDGQKKPKAVDLIPREIDEDVSTDEQQEKNGIERMNNLLKAGIRLAKRKGLIKGQIKSQKRLKKAQKNNAKIKKFLQIRQRSFFQR